MTNHHLATISVFAQEGGGNIASRIGGIALGVLAGIATALLAVAVAYGTAVAIWKLLGSMMSDPAPGKLVGIIGTVMFAVFLIGATPALIELAFNEGRAALGGGSSVLSEGAGTGGDSFGEEGGN